MFQVVEIMIVLHQYSASLGTLHLFVTLSLSSASFFSSNDSVLKLCFYVFLCLLQGFFRRSIQKQIEYKCLRDGKCLVIRLNRNRCQYCRFKKCLAAGMSKDSVRYGRMPRRSRSQDGTAGGLVGVGSLAGQAGMTTSPQPPQPDQLALYDIILTVSQAHHAFCAFTEDKIKLLKKSAFTLVSWHCPLQRLELSNFLFRKVHSPVPFVEAFHPLKQAIKVAIGRCQSNLN